MVTMTTTEATTLYLRMRILTPAMRNVLPCHGGERVEVLCVVNCDTSNASWSCWIGFSTKYRNLTIFAGSPEVNQTAFSRKNLTSYMGPRE